MTTKRKPYVRGMQPNWWTKLGFYRFYITREGTCLPQLWFSLVDFVFDDSADKVT